MDQHLQDDTCPAEILNSLNEIKDAEANGKDVGDNPSTTLCNNTPGESGNDDHTCIKNEPSSLNKPATLQLTENEPTTNESPKTPTSLYTKSVITGVDQADLHDIQYFVLSFWDNIVGPRTAHVWKTNEQMHIPRSLLQAIATRSLGGEISHGSSSANVDMKILVLKKSNVVVYSYIFEALGGILHSLSFAIPTEKNCKVIELQDLVGTHMHALVAKLRILLEKEVELDNAITLFATELYQFLQLLRSLQKAGVPDDITLQETYIHLDHAYSRQFVQKAVTAHLLCGGHSLVISPTSNQANMMIQTLAMFLCSKERKLCRLTSEASNWPYQPNLLVQGCVQSSSDQPIQALHQLDLGEFPSAVINMETQQVRFLGYIHQHLVNRHVARQRELQKYWSSQVSSPDDSEGVELLTPPDSEKIVPELFNDMDLLPPGDDLVECYLKNFMLVLNKKAFALTMFLDEHTNRGRSQTFTMNRKKIRHDLGYADSPVDFKIVLAAAEKLRPGLCGFLYKDRVKTYVHEYGFNTGKRVTDNTGIDAND